MASSKKQQLLLLPSVTATSRGRRDLFGLPKEPLHVSYRSDTVAVGGDTHQCCQAHQHRGPEPAVAAAVAARGASGVGKTECLGCVSCSRVAQNVW